MGPEDRNLLNEMRQAVANADLWADSIVTLYIHNDPFSATGQTAQWVEGSRVGLLCDKGDSLLAECSRN